MKRKIIDIKIKIRELRDFDMNLSSQFKIHEYVIDIKR